MTEEEIKLNNLDNLIYEIETKREARSLSDMYLREHNCSDREDIGVGEYSYGIIMIPEDFVLPYLKELSSIWGKRHKGGLSNDR